MATDDDMRLELQKMVESFLERGNPPSFLIRLGIMDIEGRIDFERALELKNMVAEKDGEIRAGLDVGGYEINQ